MHTHRLQRRTNLLKTSNYFCTLVPAFAVWSRVLLRVQVGAPLSADWASSTDLSIHVLYIFFLFRHSFILFIFSRRFQRSSSTTAVPGNSTLFGIIYWFAFSFGFSDTKLVSQAMQSRLFSYCMSHGRGVKLAENYASTVVQCFF